MLATEHNFNWHNFGIVFALSTGIIAFGYPLAIVGTTLGQPAFLEYFNFLTEDGTLKPEAEGLFGAIGGVFQAGSLFGLFVGAWIMDTHGRRACVIYCAVLSIISNVLVCAAQNIGMLVAFRFFAGGGSAAFLGVIPTYTAELSPPQLRGFFVGMCGLMVGIGFSLPNWMGVAFYFVHNTAAQWRAPLGIGIIFSAFMLVVVLFVPESPRWLLMQGRRDEAWEIIQKLHAVKTDADHDFAREEFYQMQTQIQLDTTLKATWLELFTRASYRKRVIITCGYAFLGQCTGVLVINLYGPSIYATLGFGVADRLLLQAGWISCSLPASLFAACIIDRVGRRPLMLLSVAGCGVCLVIETIMVALYAEAGTNKAGLAIAVVALFLFQVFYALGVDVGGIVYYAEIFPNHIRAKGVSLGVATLALSDLVFVQVEPTAVANIGWKFNLLFICLVAVGTVWAFFVLPETKGVPLEELAELFGDDEDVMVHLRDVYVDSKTHELQVEHGRSVEKCVDQVNEKEQDATNANVIEVEVA